MSESNIIDKNGRPVHPNSLKNLQSWDSESARKSQANSVIARKANKAAREALAMSMKTYKEFTQELAENDIPAVDVMKLLMHQALQAGDVDTAADLASKIAEFEQPKLARIESKVEEVSASDMSDEDLQARAKELLAKKD